MIVMTNMIVMTHMMTHVIVMTHMTVMTHMMTHMIVMTHMMRRLLDSGVEFDVLFTDLADQVGRARSQSNTIPEPATLMLHNLEDILSLH